MELRQLAYFVAVVEEGSFTRGAARVHVAQPGLSAQIRRLERELGQELLERAPRGVRPTAMGEAVLPYARAALKAVAGIPLAIDELTGLVRGHAAVGIVASISSQNLLLPGLLAEFNAAYPAVDITLVEDLSERLVASLADGSMAFAILGEAIGEDLVLPEVIASLPMSSEPMVAAVAPGHPLAGRPSVTLTDLAGYPLICLPRSIALRRRLDEACHEVGFTPRVAFEASDSRMLAELATRGLGVAVLTTTAAAGHKDDLRVLDIVRPRLRARLTLAWRSGEAISPAARALISHARERLIPSEAVDS